MNKKRCNSVTLSLRSCDKSTKNESLYCGLHEYLNGMTNEQLYKIKDKLTYYHDNITRKEVSNLLKDKDVHLCPRCNKFHFGQTKLSNL